MAKDKEAINLSRVYSTYLAVQQQNGDITHIFFIYHYFEHRIHDTELCNTLKICNVQCQIEPELVFEIRV